MWGAAARAGEQHLALGLSLGWQQHSSCCLLPLRSAARGGVHWAVLWGLDTWLVASCDKGLQLAGSRSHAGDTG